MSQNYVWHSRSNADSSNRLARGVQQVLVVGKGETRHLSVMPMVDAPSDFVVGRRIRRFSLAVRQCSDEVSTLFLTTARANATTRTLEQSAERLRTEPTRIMLSILTFDLLLLAAAVNQVILTLSGRRHDKYCVANRKVTDVADVVDRDNAH
jgi:hypothetical protein